MKITQIKQQVKNPDRVSVFVDGKYSFSLTLDQLLEQKIKKDTELDEQRLSLLKKLSDEGKLRARALEWVLGRPHSVREFRDYLFRKKADRALADALCEEFLAKKYLQEESFARWFTEGRIRKNKSSRLITAELRTKGIDQEIIHAVFSELGIADEEKGSLENLINKLSKRTRYQDQKKLTTYLLSKGFTYSDVVDSIKRHESGEG
jgi:regulatory protein